MLILKGTSKKVIAMNTAMQQSSLLSEKQFALLTHNSKPCFLEVP